jgi:hypothetical protein
MLNFTLCLGTSGRRKRNKFQRLIWACVLHFTLSFLALMDAVISHGG